MCVEEIRIGGMVCQVVCHSRHVSRLYISPVHFDAIWLLPLRVSQFHYYVLNVISSIFRRVRNVAISYY